MPKPPYRQDHAEAWRDLHERLIRASADVSEVFYAMERRSERLAGKREGIDLALSYMDEWERTGWTLAHPHDQEVTMQQAREDLFCTNCGASEAQADEEPCTARLGHEFPANPSSAPPCTCARVRMPAEPHESDCAFGAWWTAQNDLHKHCEVYHDLKPESDLNDDLDAWHRKDHTVIKTHDESDHSVVGNAHKEDDGRT